MKYTTMPEEFDKPCHGARGKRIRKENKMQSLTDWQTYVLARISKIAREARQFELANAVFARLLIESAAHHNDWEILWLADKNDPFYDLVALRPLNPNLVAAHAPNTLLPIPILKPSVAEMIFGACESEETVVPRKSGNKLESVTLYDDQVSKLWNMFFQVVPPEEAIALVTHNFTRPDVDSIVCEIQRRASRLFAVRADWFDGLPMYVSVGSVLALNSFDAIVQARKAANNAHIFVPSSALWTVSQM